MSLERKKRNGISYNNNLFSYDGDETLDGRDYSEEEEDDDNVVDEVKLYDYLDGNAVDYYSPFNDDDDDKSY